MNDDNEEIHERDKKLIFKHFFTWVESYQYDKLLEWLEKYNNYIEKNIALNIGDNLLHLSVKYGFLIILLNF